MANSFVKQPKRKLHKGNEMLCLHLEGGRTRSPHSSSIMTNYFGKRECTNGSFLTLLHLQAFWHVSFYPAYGLKRLSLVDPARLVKVGASDDKATDELLDANEEKIKF